MVIRISLRWGAYPHPQKRFHRVTLSKIWIVKKKNECNNHAFSNPILFLTVVTFFCTPDPDPYPQAVEKH